MGRETDRSEDRDTGLRYVRHTNVRYRRILLTSTATTIEAQAEQTIWSKGIDELVQYALTAPDESIDCSKSDRSGA